MDLFFIVKARQLFATALLSFSLLVGAAPVAAQQIDLTPQEAFAFGMQQLGQGNPGVAFQIASALVQRSPESYNALMLLASSGSAIGKHDVSSDAGKRAFKVARNDAERGRAARLVAATHFRAKQHTRAELWLRRASVHAGTKAEEHIIKREFAAVRRQNPLTVSLNFSLAPNSNVNNGSSSETITIWNLPFRLSADAQALSGYEASLGINLNYRLSQTRKQSTSVGLSLFGRTFELSEESKTAAPDVKGSDYSYSVAELSITQKRVIFQKLGVTSLGAMTGQNWYGGDPLNRYKRLTLGQGFRIGQRTSGNLRFTREWQTSIASEVESQIRGTDLSFSHRLAKGGTIDLSLGSKSTSSDDVFGEYKSGKLGLRYSFAKPVLGTRLSLSMGLEKRDYDLSRYDIDGRHDETLTAGISMVFTNIDYFGFSPSMNIDASRTSSNISLYDRESVGVRFGFQSNF